MLLTFGGASLLRQPLAFDLRSYPRRAHLYGIKYNVLYFTWKLTGIRGHVFVSFAVVRMQKMKSPDLKGMQFHNQRERESRTNPDIDPDRAHLNYDLLHQEKIDYNQQVKAIIESQKVSERKTRKDAVLVNELLVTSDRKFFDRLDPAEQKRFFEESYNLFSERYGQQNIAYATVHNDEKTPHMHLGVVPMRDGKLQGKNVFNRQELQWMQEEFPKHMQTLGFDVERGIASDRKHIEMSRFKALTLNEEIKTLEKETEALRNALTASKKVDELQVSKPTLFDRNHVKLPVEDFEALKARAKATEAIESTIATHEKQFDDMFDAVVSSDRKLDQEKTKTERLQKENSQLKQENQELRKENKTLRSKLNLLVEFTKTQLDKFKEWQKEREQEKQKNMARKRDQELER
uniref:Putative recombinase/mobilization protein n=2 Tax=Planococcus citreus TaxID=1373 RepID=K7Y830_9BACL|nr:putative recombinase/mobilization protein [Planococcus citreus]